jgi:hypothetical protein
MVAAVLFAIALGLRVPFRSQMAYHWDGAQFALAIGKYDMRIDQPQPPGYFLYVMLGRLVNLFVGEPHTSLVWLSVFAGAALVAVGFLLATAMFGRSVGIASGVILAMSPLCWFYSDIALTSIVDAALVTATVFVCWRVIRSGGGWREVFWMSMLFAAVAGVRQQSGAILAPVWCYALLKLGRERPMKAVSAVLLAGFFCSLWFIPMVITAGGLSEYMSLLRTKGHFDAPKTIWGGGGINALLTNVSVVGCTCWVGLLLAALISVSEFFCWVFGEPAEVKQQFYNTHVDQLRVLALWILPMLLFWLGMYVTTPGYVLCFFPGLAIVAGIAVQRIATRLSGFFSGRELMPEKRAKLIALLLVCGLVAGVNATFFVEQPRPLDSPRAGLLLTGADILQHDQQLIKCFRIIRERFRPEDVVIYHHGDQYFYWGFRQFQYHLPEYRNVLLTSDASLPGELQHKRWVGQWRQTTFIDSTGSLAERIGILVVPPGESVRLFRRYFNLSRAELLAEPGIKLYVLHQQP